MLIKKKFLFIVIGVFMGCSSSPIIISTPQQGCYDNRDYLVCSSTKGNQVAFKKESLFGQGTSGMSSNGNIKIEKLPSKAETASGVFVELYPYLKAIKAFISRK